MVKDLKPWKGTLRAIHDLDIVDKHRMILPAFTAAGGSYSSVASNAIYATVEVRAADDKYRVLERVYDDEAEADINASFKIVFDIPDAFEPLSPDAEIAVTLRKFAGTVERIVQTFKAHCL